MSYSYDYPHPAVTTDIVAFTVEDEALKVLLVERKYAPFQGRWALPGGFVGIEESLDACAQRELTEETGLEGVYLEQLYSFGDPGRDPRERVISVAYYALLPMRREALAAGSDAADVGWFDADRLPDLAFDHRQIVELARERLTAKLEYSTAGLMLTPEEFTLSEAQRLYEIVSGRPKDKRNFRKWLLSLDVIEETGGMSAGGAHRPAKLYRLKANDGVVILK